MFAIIKKIAKLIGNSRTIQLKKVESIIAIDKPQVLGGSLNGNL